MKAFDFWQAFDPGVDTTRALEILTTAYNFEKTVLDHCRVKRLSHVVVAVDSGSVQVPNMGPIEGRVFYLIFEMAKGDVRCQMDTTLAEDVVWCLKVLKDSCLGLWQIHRELIAHQDVKPSNVLVYPGTKFKISDFGRASRRGHTIWYDELNVAGDRSYAPPELLYGHVNTEFAPRRIGCDIYMLGNLAAFLFSGVNITAAILAEIAPEHHPENWGGDYVDVLPYVQDGFAKVLEMIAPHINELIREPIIQLIGELSNPDPSVRGHPKGIGRDTQYSLERYVASLDLITKRLEFRLAAKKMTA